ncbi:MAG: hypothetical protein SD837_05960 [Candidatus Electrothrix scaldis]|nr:MAG: hypothetical protein SD837_05960 [Candidatus Electrothrix sp. GW3-3]
MTNPGVQFGGAYKEMLAAKALDQYIRFSVAEVVESFEAGEALSAFPYMVGLSVCWLCIQKE